MAPNGVDEATKKNVSFPEDSSPPNGVDETEKKTVSFPEDLPADTVRVNIDNGDKTGDGRPTAAMNKSLSFYSKAYDLDGDGRLDKLEQAMRDMDAEGRGHLTNEQVYLIMKDQEQFMRKYLSMKRLLIGMSILIVILAVSSFCTAFAAVMIAKDTEEKGGNLEGTSSGKTVGTQAASTTIILPSSSTENQNSTQKGYAVDTMSMEKARELYEDCNKGRNIYLTLECDVGGQSNHIPICGDGFLHDEVNDAFPLYVFNTGGIHKTFIDCTDVDDAECEVRMEGCAVADVVPLAAIVIYKEGVNHVGETAYGSLKDVKIGYVSEFLHMAEMFNVTKEDIKTLQGQDDVAAVVPETVMHTESIPWNLDILDSASTDDAFDPKVNDVGVNGAGVIVYIMDSGMHSSHSEFDGRTVEELSFVDAETTTDDLHGHGTAIASLVGGNTIGVAKNVDFVSIKVLNEHGTGTATSVLAGIDHILQEIQAETIEGSDVTPRVVAMAFAGTQNCYLDEKVNELASKNGVTVVAASGNGGLTTTCGTVSPASASLALTVGSIDSDGTISTYSNQCGVDVYAPGSAVAAKKGGNTASTFGTSVAAAHAAGVAALLKQNFDFQTHENVSFKKIAFDTARTNANGIKVVNVDNVSINCSSNGCPVNDSPTSSTCEKTESGFSAVTCDCKADWANFCWCTLDSSGGDYDCCAANYGMPACNAFPNAC